MGALQRFEQRLESLVSGAFARAFRSAVQPVEVSAALQREIDNNAQILSRDRRLVPNEFHVELSDADLERLTSGGSAMVRDLTEQLEDHADAQGYVFPGDVEIHFEGASDLPTGQMRVRSRSRASVTGDGRRPRTRAPEVFLDINGTKHPLMAPGLVIGRGTEADIRINDPGVSRRHVEFECQETSSGPRVAVRDLGSTNGMLVDGQQISHTALRNGSVVKIGSTEIRLRLEPPAGRD